MDQPPSNYQVLAWIAAAVGVAITAIQFGFNLVRERRERRQSQLRFAYQLLDEFFDDQAGEVLRRLDRGTWERGQATEYKTFTEAFQRGFTRDQTLLDAAAVAARLEFDRVLYYFDRFEHAIRADLTLFEDVKAPLTWYVGLISPYRDGVEWYAAEVFYTRPIAFLKRFSQWSPQSRRKPFGHA